MAGHGDRNTSRRRPHRSPSRRYPESDPAALFSAPRIGTLILTALGILVSFLLLLMKLLPVFPGHFTRTEWLALALWLLLGAALRRRPAPATATHPSTFH